ncbi:MAG: methyltransferase domain-containing protein [Pseudomonadota bacterium]
MPVPPSLSRAFAEQIRAVAPLQDGPWTERLLAAFAAVPREDHAGPGPWLLRAPIKGLPARRTPDADPAHLYHNVLIALDEARHLNVGEPALWARSLAHAPIEPGASILQVGTGGGYFTALLSELAGPSGRVLATEIDSKLAAMAEASLAGRPNVTVRHANGALDLAPDDGPFDLVVAFAGATHPPRAWTSRLAPQGRLLAPLTGPDWAGAMILARPEGDGLAAETLSPCGFFPCEGARDPAMAERLAELFANPARLSGFRFRIAPDGDGVRYLPA